MGVNWVRMRPREGIDLREIDYWVRQQNESIAKEYYLTAFTGVEVRKTNLEKYIKACCALDDCLELPMKPLDYWSLRKITDNLDPMSDVVLDAETIRAYVISENPVFPMEWRLEAIATFLPTQLHHVYRKWHKYVLEIRNGGHRGFLFDLFLYNNYIYSGPNFCAKTLKEELQLSLSRSNAWAKKENFLKIREQLFSERLDFSLGINDPMLYPRFDSNLEKKPVENQQVEKHQQFVKELQIISQKCRMWNRCVPTKRKIRVPTITFPDFEEFVREGIDNNWLCCFFQWCEQLIRGGYGLLVWV